MVTKEKVIRLEPWQSSTGLLITAQSHLIDRFVPDCEIIQLPSKVIGGGEMTLRQTHIRCERSRPAGLWPRLSKALQRTPVREHGGLLIDLRDRSPENWAHFLTSHVLLVFFFCREMEIAVADCVVLLPSATPRYIREAAMLFNIPILCTDDVVTGPGIDYRLSSRTMLRSVWTLWVEELGLRAHVDRFLQQGSAVEPLPKRVFLSRRKTRHLENAAEIETLLAARGFVTIYPEDLPPADQFRVFEEAEVIVAIHGAGLAPLLYRSPHSRLQHLIEILPVGHMTDVYRTMAEQLGVGWTGVRGRIKPEHVAPAYDLTRPFRQFSLSAFSVDTKALEMALRRASLT